MRLYSGLVLFSFVSMHFANHMLALVSFDLAEKVRPWFLLLWRNPVGTILLYSALLTHVGLALFALYRRRTLVMPFREACQVTLGLLIPLLIAEHVIGTRLNEALTGVPDTYRYVAYSLWVASPTAGMRQIFAVFAVWVHACLGLYFWQRQKPWFERAGAPLLVVAALVPVLTTLAFVTAGRSVADLGLGLPAPDEQRIMAAGIVKERAVAAIYSVYGLALVTLLALRFVRSLSERSNMIEIRYPDGKVSRVPRGYSVLEASRLAGIPHHSVCGGRGRCSTCRVVVLDHLAEQPSPEAVEAATLERINAPPDVRLACQLRPVTDIKVAPVLATEESVHAEIVRATPAPGREREVAVLFCDIRDFTRITSRSLPFDTVFMLNRYFAIVGRAVEAEGGRLDKFIGDGAMAIFGLETGPDIACRQALAAAKSILEGLDQVSRELEQDLAEPLRVAIGIHSGPAIAGTMGYGRTTNVTVIGETVNVASRLESLAKEMDAAIVISRHAAEQSRLELKGYSFQQVEIRGMPTPLEVCVIGPMAARRMDTARISPAAAVSA
ncbi:MAG: adenylate/guanylate cyclase domain-containing protein [Rhizobiaceae bacterium]|nr:adenylate/guanylate cyclase domain-containing protein [Rhizobiaceae bacterium]